MSKAHGPLADRPINPKVGLEISHESAGLHVTGKALYTQDLVNRTKDTLHAWPVQAPHAHAMVTGLRVERRLRGARGGQGADRRRRPRPERRRREARRAAVPHRGHVLRARRLLGARRERWRRRGRAPTPSQVDYQPLPSLVTIQDAIAADSFQGHARTVSRGDADAAMDTAAHRFSGEFEFGGQEHFYLETNAALALVDENGQVFVQSSTQHPSETQDIVAHVLGMQCPPRHRAVPADGRRLRRQGVPAARPGRDRRAGRGAHRPAGEPAAEPHPGHHHDRQAAPVPGQLGGRLRRRQPDLRAAGHADQQRRLEPRPVRAGARPGAVPHRQRLLDPGHHRARPDRQDQPELQHGVPRLRRPAGHDRHRGHPGPLRTAARGRAGRPAAQQLLRTRPGHAVRPAGPARRTARRHLVDPDRAQRLPRPQGRDRRVQRRAPGHQTRAGHDAGEVRHLVQPDGVQPGRRAGARLQGRLGADQPRRRRDGTGPAHQDDPGRGHLRWACR